MKKELIRASFHDPDGSVYFDGELVWRVATKEAGERIGRFLNSSTALELLANGVIPSTQVSAASPLPWLPGDGSGQQWFRHERLPFLNYPHEWLPEQLVEAVLATLGLAQRLREQGWDIKDGNARNIVFDGLRPVFVDFGSFVERDDYSPIWRPAGQIQRHFLLPLLTFIHLGLKPSQMLLGRPDGLCHDEAYACLKLKTFTDRHVFWVCALPAWLSRIRLTSKLSSLSEGASNSQLNITAADRTIASLKFRAKSLARQLTIPKSQWTGYESCRFHYTESQLAMKRDTVSRMLQYAVPQQVLDVGTNGGEFANLAASFGAKVVSIDLDLDALRLAHRSAKEQNLNVLHLHVDFAAPTPALGWGQAECQSFDDRARGHFDLVLALALIHHVLVVGRIPLNEILQRLAQYTKSYLIIEYVDPSDVMFDALSSSRDLDFSWLNRSAFEEALRLYFAVMDRTEIVPGRRELYLCCRRES
jgi:SAM-dependent methyltransferase